MDYLSLLSHVISPKPTDAPQAQQEAREREREHSSRLSSLSNFSLGDMFDSFRDGSKSVKFPEKLLKVLDQRLEKIGMNQDPAYVLPFFFFLFHSSVLLLIYLNAGN